VYHLVSERLGDKPDTIDGYVLKMLRRKKNLIDRVIGEAAVGALEFDERVTKSLLRQMQGKSDA
jgi:SNF2 family DNA or RNA helicase